MLLHWRTVGLGALLLLVALAVFVIVPGGDGIRAGVAVPEVPAPAQASAARALLAKGYQAGEGSAWAGAQSAWQVPGYYRLFYAAPSAEGAADIYAATVWVDAQGEARRVVRVDCLTRTPAGEETAPIVAGGWLAFATRVAGRYQNVTCVPLTALQQPDVYAFGQPVEGARLTWRSSPGQAPTLSITASDAAEQKVLNIDPAAKRVEPASADLRYLPVARGEQAWLPNLVSRIRELPGVGPEKIAFLENVFFTVVDYVTRLFHGPVTAPAAAVPQPTPSPGPAEEPPTPMAIAEQATAVPTPAASATPTLAPTPQGKRLADGIVWRDTVKPDPQRPYADVEIVEIDPGLLQIKMILGTIEPKPSTGLVGTGVIPQEDWPFLVAGFNGGFAAMHGQYGMMVDRKVYLPPRDGIATLAVYEDGSIRMGTWGEGIVQTPDMVSYRQNCPPLIENGMITAETGKLTLWGLSIANEVYLYRSGLGVTRDGRLVYVAGKPLSAYTLARALQMAGAEYAMQLDVDEFHVAFFTYEVQGSAEGNDLAITGHKLRNDMRGFDGYFLRPFQLDFFYLLRRPERLAQAVRLEAARQAPAATPTLAAQDLPGQIAFASDRDGNWELYVVKPGQPASIRRLTDHPADDLYPAWSRDGRQLAFASRRDGNSEIYVMDVATGDLRRITNQGSEEWAPTRSPDGKFLAYQSDRNGQSDVYVCAVDGGGETRLTPMEGNHEAPDWSPDGQRFVFDSDLDVSALVHASINLYIMNADGSNPYRILGGAESPRWSPDGRNVALTTRRAGFWQVYLCSADGSGLRQLSKGRYDARYPAWSRDGRWLAFAGHAEGHWELYAMPVAGGEPLRLTAGLGDSTYPAWGP